MKSTDIFAGFFQIKNKMGAGEAKLTNKTLFFCEIDAIEDN